MYVRKLSDWLESFLEFTDYSEAPTIFRKWVGISTVAGMLQRKCYIQWDQPTYPNMYIVLVGPSGAGKGTAMRPARDILDELGATIAPESVIREELINVLEDTAASFIIEGIQEYHSSMNVWSDEMTVFVGRDKSQLVMDLTNWYDCPNRWRYATKNSGKNDIGNVFVNWLAATTPQQLSATLTADALAGGLTARIIFIFAQKREKLIAMPWLHIANKELKEALLSDLSQSISQMQGMYKLNEKFINKYVPWYEDPKNQNVFSSDMFDGYSRRRPKHLIKLAMVISACRNESMILTEHDFDKALDILKEAELVMPRAFAGVGESDLSGIMGRVETFVESYKNTNMQTIMRRFALDADYDKMTRVMLTLESQGKIIRRRNKVGDFNPDVIWIGKDKEDNSD